MSSLPSHIITQRSHHLSLSNGSLDRVSLTTYRSEDASQTVGAPHNSTLYILLNIRYNTPVFFAPPWASFPGTPSPAPKYLRRERNHVFYEASGWDKSDTGALENGSNSN